MGKIVDKNGCRAEETEKPVTQTVYLCSVCFAAPGCHVILRTFAFCFVLGFSLLRDTVPQTSLGLTV